jgi:putative membrane protein
MKRMALLSLAFAAMVTVGCRGDRPYQNTENPNEAIGTSGKTADRAKPADPAKPADRGTQEFVEHAMMDNMAEVQLGKLASSHAQNPAVKQFAQTMVRDHSKAANELKQIATHNRMDVKPPAQLDEKHQKLMDKLSNLHGAEFDHEYMDAMVDGHRDVLNDMQSRVDEKPFGPHEGEVQPEKSVNPKTYSVNAWAAKTLPIVREHLDRARDVREKLSQRANNP